MRIAVAALTLSVAACGQGEQPARAPERDPASEQALGDQILIDPDLANQNEGNAALTVSSDHSLPSLLATGEAAAAARADAALAVGGSDQLIAPPPARSGDFAGEISLDTPAQFAAGVRGARDCARSLTYTATWAARLPDVLPVYPRGATLEAAGSDAGQCAVRVVRFATPVQTEDVLAFYATLARKARLSTDHRVDGETHILDGARGRTAFRLTIRSRQEGLTEAVLVTSGFSTA